MYTLYLDLAAHISGWNFIESRLHRGSFKIKYLKNYLSHDKTKVSLETVIKDASDQIMIKAFKYIYILTKINHQNEIGCGPPFPPKNWIELKFFEFDE